MSTAPLQRPDGHWVSSAFLVDGRRFLVGSGLILTLVDEPVSSDGVLFPSLASTQNVAVVLIDEQHFVETRYVSRFVDGLDSQRRRFSIKFLPSSSVRLVNSLKSSLWS